MSQPSAIRGDCKVTCNRKLPSANVCGELVIMSVENDKYYGLDQIASDVWRRIGDGTCLTQLCDEVAACYQGPREDIERDLLRLLTQMRDYGLLQIHA